MELVLDPTNLASELYRQSYPQLIGYDSSSGHRWRQVLLTKEVLRPIHEEALDALYDLLHLDIQVAGMDMICEGGFEVRDGGTAIDRCVAIQRVI